MLGELASWHFANQTYASRFGRLSLSTTEKLGSSVACVCRLSRRSVAELPGAMPVLSFERHQRKIGEDLPVILHFTANEGAKVVILGPESMQTHSVGSESSACND